jgi:Ca2+-binding EF-hand superfamily protein
MGSLCSTNSTAGAFTNAEREEVLVKFEALRLAMHFAEKDFFRMYQYFNQANTSEDGCIQLDEFLTFFQQPKTRFTMRVFTMFCDGNAEGITFKQWVFALWNFCTTDSDALILFAFQLYDREGKGLLNVADVKHMLLELFGKDFERNSLARDLTRQLLEMDYKGNPTTSGITAVKFAKVASKAKNLLYPAFKLQNAIQHKIFSERYWLEKTDERSRLQAEGVLDIREVLDMVNEGRRRLAGHVVKGGVIMPYVSARGHAETEAERAERERLNRFKGLVEEDTPAGALPKRVVAASLASEAGAVSASQVRGSIVSEETGAVAAATMLSPKRSQVSPSHPHGRAGSIIESPTAVATVPRRMSRSGLLTRGSPKPTTRQQKLNAATRKAGL